MRHNILYILITESLPKNRRASHFKYIDLTKQDEFQIATGGFAFTKERVVTRQNN